jgi:MAST domain-containing protein
MNIRFLLTWLIISLMLIPTVVTASSPYGKMDVYFNGKVLPGNETAKPILKIGEPFNIGINLTVDQKCYVSVMLTEIGDNDFEIMNGSTLKMKDYGTELMEKDSSRIFKWTVKPTDKWAGGSLPIDVVYQINDFDTLKTLVNSGFTVAYCTISNEHYKGEVFTPKEQKTSEKEPSPTSKPAPMPGFSSVSAIVALSLAFLAFYRQAL